MALSTIEISYLLKHLYKDIKNRQIETTNDLLYLLLNSLW